MSLNSLKSENNYTSYNSSNIRLFNEDVMKLYDLWDTPTVIISDGAYGVSGFPGDTKNYKDLPEWYEPHIKKWSEKATPQTTLWLWNTEQGWATLHPVLLKYGWDFKACHVWNKGLSHVAGNVNTKTISHLPIVTEVCVQYVKKPIFNVNNKSLTMQEWLRYEWARTGLPFSKTNIACGLKNAATRKYFTNCHLWYMPPSEMFEKIVNYANSYGKTENKPFFSINKKTPLTKEDWEHFVPKFKCLFGMTNVWQTPQLAGSERIKIGTKTAHLNQKPLALIEKIIQMSSDENDVIWEPFGGLFTVALASKKLNRVCYSAEINNDIWEIALNRFSSNHKI